MNTKTPRTDALDRKQTNHISGSSNDAGGLLDALHELLEYARELETELSQSVTALKAAERHSETSNHESKEKN